MDPAFASFAECIATPVVLLTPDVRVVYANTAFTTMVGTSPERLRQEGFPEPWLAKPHDALPQWQQLIHEAARGNTPDPIRISVRSASETEIDMRAHAAPWAGSSDTSAGYIVATFLPLGAASDSRPQHSEAPGRYEGLIETSDDSLFTLDPAGHVLSVNESWLKRFGYTADETIGISAIDRVPPEFCDACREALQNLRDGQTKDNLLFRAVAKGGEPVDLLITLKPVFDTAGKVTRIVGTGGDINELRQAQEELRRSEERQRILFQYAPDGCYLCDLEGRFLDVNLATARISGRTREELLGASILELGLVPESEHARLIALFSTAASGRPLPRTEFTACRKDGTAGTVEITGHPVVIEGQTLLLGAARDITERKQSEERLKESLSRVRATLESTADGIIVVDDRGQIKDFNEQFKDLWHISSEAMETRDTNRALAVCLAQLTDPEAYRATVERLRGRPDREGNGTLQFKDGRVVEYCVKPQWLENRIVGRVWSFRDITDAHRARQEQDKLLQQVAQINEELSHFAYVVSHDLKAPLRGIRMLADWLATDCASRLNDEAKENFALLQNRVERMHNLIDGILQYSRVGHTEEGCKDIDLHALLTEVIDDVAPPEHIAIRIDGPLPVIRYERTRITQVFLNLLTNAVKYMDKPAGHIVVGCTEDEGAWTFSVSDNGSGIEKKHFDRIFKIFQTLAPRDEFESTGVGLTLVKRIVEYYGGRIWVTSEAGQGSTFFFTVLKAFGSRCPDGMSTDGAAIASKEVPPCLEASSPVTASDAATREKTS